MEITMVRHGQAQSGAKDEASYDKLSPLGHQQAAWLGTHLQELGRYDRVVSGTMRRQIETGQGLALPGAQHDQDARLNEMDYFGLAHFLRDEKGLSVPTSQAEFQGHVREVLRAWAGVETGPHLESYVEFKARILGAVRDVAGAGQQTVVVSSTGVIATLMAIALDLDIHRKANVFLRIAHTSVHKFALDGDDLHLLQFCATPHLDAPDRAHARTTI